MWIRNFDIILNFIVSILVTWTLLLCGKRNILVSVKIIYVFESLSNAIPGKTSSLILNLGQKCLSWRSEFLYGLDDGYFDLLWIGSPCQEKVPWDALWWLRMSGSAAHRTCATEGPPSCSVVSGRWHPGDFISRQEQEMVPTRAVISGSYCFLKRPSRWGSLGQAACLCRLRWSESAGCLQNG